MRALTVLSKDLRILGRRRGLLALLMLYPLVTVGVLGVGFQPPQSKVPVAWVNLDQDATRIELDGQEVTIATLRARLAEAAAVVDAPSEEAGIALLRRGEVDAVLVIPPHFLQDVQSLVRSTNVTIVVDPSDPVRAQVADSLLRGVAQAFVEGFIRFKMQAVLRNLELALEGNVTIPGFGEVRGFRVLITDLEQLRASGSLTAQQRQVLDADLAFLRLAVDVLEDSSGYLRATALPVEVVERGITARALRPTDIVAPLAIALSILWTASLAGASIVGLERRRGLLARLLQTPTSAWSVALGKLLAALVLVTVQSLALLALAVGALGVQSASLPLALAVILLASLSTAGLGMLIAAFARGVEDAVLITIFVAFPMFLASGVLFPVAYMPAPFRAVASLLPPTIALDALRAAMLRGADLAQLAGPLAFLGLAGATTFVLTALALRRSAGAGA